MGQPFMAFSAGPLDAFNHSISFMVQCDDQTEIDRLWAALSDGGKVERCGWLKDRYGLYWQIAPSILGDMMKDPDRMRAAREANIPERTVAHQREFTTTSHTPPPSSN